MISFTAANGQVVELPFEQAMSVAACVRTLRDAGKEVTWHRNDCGCCIAVHEAHGDGEPCRAGFIVGEDGGADWIEVP